VSFLLLGSALAAGAALSWLHLRPAGVRRAAWVPSLQHLRGASPRTRRALPLEEPLAWALRAACLLLVLLGTWASRSGCAEDVPPVAVVDPAATASAWAKAQALAPTRLGFVGQRPLVEGEAKGPLEAALRACSDTLAACLLRTADSLGRPVLLVGPLASTEWRLALAQRAKPFAFVRTEKAEAQAPAEARVPPPVSNVRLDATSDAARLWAAALQSAATQSDAAAAPIGVAEGAPVVVVAPGPPPSTPLAPGALTLLAVAGPSIAQPDSPAAKLEDGMGLLFPDPLDLAAGTAGLGLHTSLAFAPDARFTPVLRVLARAKGPGAPLLALAATAEELGSWAHEGSLLPLARAVLAAGLDGPTQVRTAPPGGALGWTDGLGQAVPVGLLDVSPGRYLRTDGRVVLQLERPDVQGTDAPDDAALAHLGGRPFLLGPAGRPRLPALLFSVALGLWLWGVLLTRRLRRAWLPALAFAVGLALLVADAHWAKQATAAWTARLAVPAGPSAEALATLARAASVTGVRTLDASWLACASPSALAPCTPLGSVGWASSAPTGVDMLLFDVNAPRVDVLSVESPREVPLGSAAEVWTTLRVRRAEGRHVTLSVRSTSAAPATEEFPVDGRDVVRTVRLALSPLSEGVAFLAVEARVKEAPQAEDGRLLALAARTSAKRRLVLAAAPGWEARAVAAALQTEGASVDVLSLLGTRAVVARGRPARSPSDVLHQPEALQGVGLLALVGFGAGDLDAAARDGLRRYVASGGAALLLQAPGAAAALGVEVPELVGTTPLQPLVGQVWPLDGVPFRGYAPPAHVQSPPGMAVLGRLGAAGESAMAPWVLGRALGQGRFAVVTAPDIWRLSPPGRGSQAYRHVLARLVGWLEAPAASRGHLVLAEDWSSLRLEGGARPQLFPLPAEGPADGLAVDAVELATFNHSPRASLRAAAAGQHHPFLELEGPEALAAAWHRLPTPPSWKQDVRLRASDAAFSVLAGLLVLEALGRRRYGGSGGSGSRARSAASSLETGGTISGEGRSQRASATPAAREAARNAASSLAA
jgi:hypothetical protein